MKNFLKFTFSVILFILFLCVFETYAKEYPNNSYGGFENSRCNSRNLGTAKKLQGKTYVCVLFVTEDGTPISQKEKKNFKACLNTTGIWLNYIAREYGKDFLLKIEYFGDGESNEYQLPYGYKTSNLKPRNIAEEYFGRNYYDFIKSRAVEKGCNNFIFLICANAYGCSYVYKSNESYTFSYRDYFEGGVINLKTNGNLATVITHEVLHAFGAWDLYTTEKYNIYSGAGSKYKYLTETSIMANTNDALASVCVDDLTAYLVGLTDEKQDWFDILANNGGY